MPFSSNSIPQPSLAQVGIPVVLFIVYVLTARLGFYLDPSNTFSTVVWLPAGISLAALLLYGYWLWLTVLIAATVVNLSLDVPLLVALTVGAGNTLGPLVGAWFVKRYSHFQALAFHVRDSVAIIASALLTPLITATVGVLALWGGGQIGWSALNNTWGSWFLGDAVGILVCTPLILKWLNRRLRERSRSEQLELILAIATTALTGYYIFWQPQGLFAYYVFIPLTWVALRTGPRGTTASVALIAMIGLLGTVAGHGPFATQGLFELQLFVGILSGIFLLIAAIVEERRNALATLEQHIKELEEALHKISSEDEAKKKFLAILAHELRNPLATILSSIELIHLEHSSVPGTMRKSLETIDERARAMVHLLDDLLDISRVSHNKLTLQKELILVDHFIDRLVPTIQPVMRRYGHTFSVAKPDQELYVEADPTRLEQILVNLLSNAAKYTNPKGLIQFSAKKTGDWLALHVTDSGVGIPKNMLQRIFDPFFQVNQGASTNHGLGVGLALTRELVELHGGTIEARSGGAQHGSEFIVRLPLATAPPTSDKPSSEGVRTHHADGARGLKILVVDDNVTATEALTRLLELRGHTTATAFTGTEAVETARQFLPDVIFLDIGLPDIDGYLVAKQLRTHARKYHLIALTGYGQVEDKERARAAGFDHHLTKPAGLKEIEHALRAVPQKKPRRVRSRPS